MLRLLFGAITHVIIVIVWPFILLSVFRHVKHFKAVYSAQSEAKAYLSTKH